jgi:hypothetical protein
VTVGNETKATSLLCCVQLGESLGETAIVDNCVNSIQVFHCAMRKDLERVCVFGEDRHAMSQQCLIFLIQELINVEVTPQEINAIKIRIVFVSLVCNMLSLLLPLFIPLTGSQFPISSWGHSGFYFFQEESVSSKFALEKLFKTWTHRHTDSVDNSCDL